MPEPRESTSRIHLPSLALGLLLMLAGTLYPLFFRHPETGHADHAFAFAVFWAMSAAFVKGVGFMPRATVWRLLFSGKGCLVALAIATLVRIAG